MWASHCSGFSCYGARTLGLADFSSCSSRAPEHRFNSCGAWALLHGMSDHPGSGIKAVSPTLAGGILTTELPGKPNSQDFKLSHLLVHRTDEALTFHLGWLRPSTTEQGSSLQSLVCVVSFRAAHCGCQGRSTTVFCVYQYGSFLQQIAALVSCLGVSYSLPPLTGDLKEQTVLSQR